MPTYYGGIPSLWPSRAKYRSFIDFSLDGAGSGASRRLDATCDFTAASGEYPFIHLLGGVGAGEIHPMDQPFLDHGNTDFPSSPEGWYMQSGWACAIRWHYFSGADEVTVPKGTTPVGSFIGQERLQGDDVTHSLIVPSGVLKFRYSVVLPANVTRVTCEMLYDGGPTGDEAGHGAFHLDHSFPDAEPPYPYADPALHAGGGDWGVVRFKTH